MSLLNKRIKFSRFSNTRLPWKRPYTTSLLNYMPCVPTFLRVSAVYVPTCLRANFLFLRASVPMNLPTCYRACQFFSLSCQFFNLGYQHTKDHASFSNISLTKYLGKVIYFKNSTLYLNHTSIAHKNCIILHFCTPCHLKEKCVEFLLSESFFLFS